MSIAEHLHQNLGDCTAAEFGKDIAALDKDIAALNKKHKSKRFALKLIYRALAAEEDIEPDYDTARKAAAKAAKQESGDND